MHSTNTNPATGDGGARQGLLRELNAPADNSHSELAAQDCRNVVLAELRHFSACLRFMTAEVDMIGRQLRSGAINTEQAQWMVNHLSDPADILRRATQ